MKPARGALRNNIPGYAGGGLIDGFKRAVGMAPAETMREKFAREDAARKPVQAQPVAAPISPTPTLNTPAPMGSQGVIDKRMAAAGAYRGAKIKPNMAKEAGNGGMIKGPGTPTSDSIPAKVVDTGEPIKVATGERIVSKKQDAFLKKLAAEMGFDSVDAMMEAGTGEPVGPTMKYDNDADEQGGASDMDGGEPIKHAGLGALIDGVKRSVGILPPETMIQKIARQDAERAQKQQSAPAVQTTTPAQPQAIAAPMGNQSVLDNREKRAGLANGGQIDSNMALEANKGLFSGGDPYAIPGYTPGMVQRSGMGLPGYNPLTQGQTMNMPTNGGNANADDMEKTEAKGFACGGAIRKHMATGGVVGQLVKLPFVSLGYDHSKVQSLGPGLRGAAGGASPEELAHNKALESAQALATARASGAKLTPEAESANRTSYLADLQASNDMKPSTPYMKQAKADANQAASGALRTIYGSPVQAVAPPSAVQQPAQLPAAQAAPPAAIPTATVQAPAPQPVSTPVAQPVQLSPADGVNVGNGITRFDAPGKSPLFTNMTDAAGMASNQALMNRGAIRPEDQAIAQAMSDRFGREAQNTNQRAANATQMATETAMAQRSTDAGLKLAESVGQRIDGERARQNAESTLSIRNINPAQRQAASDTLKNLNQRETAREAAAHVDSRAAATDATTRREQDIRAHGQEVQTGALRQNNQFNQQLARDKFGIEQSQESRAAAKDALDAKQRDRLQSAFDAYDKDPSEKSAERVRVLMGKEKAAPPDSWGIRKVTDATGAVTEIPYNKATGEDRGSNQAGQAPLPPGMVKQVGTANGKPVYLDKNGKQVIAKG